MGHLGTCHVVPVWLYMLAVWKGWGQLGGGSRGASRGSARLEVGVECVGGGQKFGWRKS